MALRALISTAIFVCVFLSGGAAMTLTRKFNAQAARSGATIGESEDESARAGSVLTRFWSGGRRPAAIEPEILQPAEQENRPQRAREAVSIRLLRAPRAP